MKALIKGSKLIQAAIDSVARRGVKLDNDVQLAALSILAHVDEHKDTTLADRLVAALPKGARRLALVEWFVNFGKMRLLDKANPDEAKRITEGAMFKYDAKRTTDMQAAAEKPWHTMRKEADVATVFDAKASVVSLLARIKGAQTKGLTIEGKAEALAQLAELTALLKAE